MQKSTRGFTIVELLIVIVVIAILAAISIVAYNGVQTRSKNAKTVSAISAWTKAIKLYNAELGSWPTANSCLGTPDTYQGNNGQCWNSTTWVMNGTFLTQMNPYMSNYPEPDVTNVATGGSSPRRGALYHAGERDIFAAFSSISTCPDVGLSLVSTGTESAGIHCRYTID